jgi:NADPH:quinone reductase-like Zn-dependent oxidoreductase
MKNRKIIIPQFGSPDVLQPIEEQELPEPGPGEVRVKVSLRCANFTDTMIRKGKYPDVKDKPPFSPGYDMIGIADKLGSGVSGISEGDRVADLTVTGSYAEYMCIPAGRLVPVPEDLDDAAAVCLVLSYVTAYQMLHRKTSLTEGDSILVHGASGAVGSALLQLGALMGLEIYGTASKEKQSIVTRFGAEAIDYANDDFLDFILQRKPEGVDAVFDPIGGKNFRRSFKALSRGGTMTAYGFYNAVSGRGGSIPLDFMWLSFAGLLPNGKKTGFYSIGSWRETHPEWFRKDLETLFGLLSEEKIAPLIGNTMSLNEAREAHELLEQSAVSGKIVLKNFY